MLAVTPFPVPALSDAEWGLLLLLLATAAAAITSRRGLSASAGVAATALGLCLALGDRGLLDRVLTLPRETVALLLLPPLLFPPAAELGRRGLARHRGLLLLLGVGGTLGSALLIGAAARLLLDVSWSGALLLGLLLAPPDPDRLGLRPKDRTELGPLALGEPLLGFALVAPLSLLLIEGSTLGWDWVDPEAALLGATGRLAGGGAIGLGLSLAARRLRPHPLSLAYGCALAGAIADCSPVAAVIAAGLGAGSGARRRADSTECATSAPPLLPLLCQAALLIGVALQVAPAELGDRGGAIVGLLLAAVAARALFVFGLGGLDPARGSAYPAGGFPLLTWGGVRGVIPLALLPTGEGAGLDDGGALLRTACFGVATLSLLLHSPLRTLLLRRIDPPGGGRVDEDSGG